MNQSGHSYVRSTASSALFLFLLLDRRGNAAWQREQPDEALGVLLVVHLVGAERGEVVRVQAELRAPLDRRGRALVHADDDFAGHAVIEFLDAGPKRLAQRREPFAVVDDLGEFLGHLLTK